MEPSEYREEIRKASEGEALFLRPAPAYAPQNRAKLVPMARLESVTGGLLLWKSTPKEGDHELRRSPATCSARPAWLRVSMWPSIEMRDRSATRSLAPSNKR